MRTESPPRLVTYRRGAVLLLDKRLERRRELQPAFVIDSGWIAAAKHDNST